MLILTRKPGQSLQILPRVECCQQDLNGLFQDGPIEISILKIRGNQVRIGINAHRSLLVLRDEIALRPDPSAMNSGSVVPEASFTNTRLILSQNVRVQRFLRQWSRQDLSYVTGLRASYIELVETTAINIGIDNVEKFAFTFNLSITELLNLPNKTTEKRIFSALLIYGGLN